MILQTSQMKTQVLVPYILKIFRSGLTLFNSNDGIAIKINIKKSLRRYTKLYKLYKKLVAPNETKKGKRT